MPPLLPMRAQACRTCTPAYALRDQQPSPSSGRAGAASVRSRCVELRLRRPPIFLDFLPHPACRLRCRRGSELPFLCFGCIFFVAASSSSRSCRSVPARQHPCAVAGDRIRSARSSCSKELFFYSLRPGHKLEVDLKRFFLKVDFKVACVMYEGDLSKLKTPIFPTLRIPLQTGCSNAL